jgi:hypothetical protein
LFSSAIFGFAGHRCTQEWGAGGVRSEKLSHKNAIKYEKRRKRGPSSFSDNPKYPPEKNLAKTPGTPPPLPLDFQLLCIYVADSWFQPTEVSFEICLGLFVGLKKEKKFRQSENGIFCKLKSCKCVILKQEN